MLKKKIFVLTCLLLVLGCGKKINDSKDKDGDSSNRDSRDGQVSETLRRFVNNQTHVCDDELHCHQSVAKLVVVDRDNIRYCTGTLVASDVLVTSSSCLPKSLKVPSLDCSTNIFAIFPETTFLPTQTVGCKNIVSSDTNEDEDPALWKSDFAFIKLNKKINRKVIKISKKGLKEDVPYRSYKVDFENDYDGSQKLTYCFPVYNSYANPFSDSRYSPMITVRDCKHVLGNSGAALFDFSGEIVGLFSGKMDKGVINFVNNSDLMIEQMAPVHHVINTACMDWALLSDGLVKNDCSKPINTTLLDRQRSKLLLSKKLHKKNMDSIEFDLENPVKYFKWDVKFHSGSKGRLYEPHFSRPKCFFDINTWVGEFTRWGGRIREWTTISVDVPDYKIETKLDRKLKPVSFVSQKGEKTYSVSFNPRYAYNHRNTIVIIRGEVQGNQVSKTYQDITDVCSE